MKIRRNVDNFTEMKFRTSDRFPEYQYATHKRIKLSVLEITN